MIEKKFKIILYGVRCNRSYFERNLNNKYQIVGYTDGSDEYKDLSEFDYLPYYTIDKLHFVEFDYIVVLPGGKSAEIILARLLEAQVALEKIIEYGIFSTNDFRNPMQEYINLNRGFDGFVFGMSHSYYGFLTHWFDKKLFKFSSPSMDLYYNALVLKRLTEYHKDILNKGKNNYFIFEMPYYAFNFDLSMTINNFRSRLSYFEPFNDYHNYVTDESRKQDILQYKIFKDMLSIEEKVRNITSNNFEKKSDLVIDKNTIDDIIKELPRMWSVFHKTTIKENIEIWKQIIQMVKKINPKAKIIVLIYPNNPCFIEAHRSEIYKMKDSFYENIKDDSISIEIFDYFEAISEADSFKDHCHLNNFSCIEFSKYLNKEFCSKLY